MENPFDRPPINVTARHVGDRVRRWRKDYLAAVSPTKAEKGLLLESLRTGEDPTIRDGVNLALSRLVDPEAPKDALGKSAFLVHDGPERVSLFKRSWPRKQLPSRLENRRS